MRTPIFLTVVLALIAGMAGVAAAAASGWRQHHAFSRDGHKLDRWNRHGAVEPGFRHHRGKYLEHRGGHRAALKHRRHHDGHFAGWKHRRHHGGHFAGWKHHRHHAYRPAFVHPHRGGHFVFARDPFGSSIRIIVGDRRGHGPKWHRHRRHH
jgi:hypothetical protein